MNTTIDIPDALYRKAKIRAAQRGVTLKALLVDSLTRGISDDSGKEPEGPDFVVNEDGVPIIPKRPGVVITNEMIDRMREDEGV